MTTAAANPDRPELTNPLLTPIRVAIDLTFGLVLPLGCLMFDPAVFRGDGLFKGGMLAEYAVVGYTAAAMGMVVLVAWLVLGRWPGLFAGLLAGGAVFAAGLGVVMLPLTLPGLFICIGVFGLVPFATAAVFAGNARRAWAAAKAGRSNRGAVTAAATGFAVACLGPWVANGYVKAELNRATEQLTAADPAEVDRGVETLTRFRFLGSGSLDNFVWAYDREHDPDRRAAMARAYSRVTGDDIEHRLAILKD